MFWIQLARRKILSDMVSLEMLTRTDEDIRETVRKGLENPAPSKSGTTRE